MKKILLSLIATALLAVSSQAQTVTYSQVVLPNTMTNILVGPFRLTSLNITATNTASGLLVDSATNLTTQTFSAYSNVVSYVTNISYFYTNYFGVVNTNSGGTPLAGSAFNTSNYCLVDITNSVAAATVNLPYVAIGTASTTILTGQNIVFYRGIELTNTGTAPITLSITGLRQ
jgi:hypothetical protein